MSYTSAASCVDYLRELYEDVDEMMYTRKVPSPLSLHGQRAALKQQFPLPYGIRRITSGSSALETTLLDYLRSTAG